MPLSKPRRMLECVTKGVMAAPQLVSAPIFFLTAARALGRLTGQPYGPLAFFSSTLRRLPSICMPFMADIALLADVGLS